MSSNVGLLKVVLSADTAEFSQAMDNAQGDITSFADAAQKLGPVFQSAAAVAAGAAVAMVGATQSAAIEINRLSQVAGASARDFQFYAFGAKNAGVEMDKFADILKDVQDKIGDFATTGGGPLKDFFETIGAQAGLTAESFRDLSGPQALQLFYTTLEKANVSQKDMVFWLEAIASDATLLQPLLKNGGAAFDEMGRAAEDFGAIISNEAIAASLDLDRSITALQNRASGFSTTIASELLPIVAEVAREMAEFANENGFAEKAATALRIALESVVLIGSDVVFAFRGIGREIGGIAAQAVALASFDFDAVSFIGEEMKKDAAAARAELEEFQNRIVNLSRNADLARDAIGAIFKGYGDNRGQESYTDAVVQLIALNENGIISADRFHVELEKLAKIAGVTTNAVGGGAGGLGGGLKDFSDAAKKAAADAKKFADETQRHFERMMDAELAALQTSRDLAGEGVNAALAELSATRDRIAAAEEEGAAIGLSGRQLAELTRQRYYQVAALKEEAAAALEAIEPGADLAQIYREQAEALRELGGVEYDNTVATAFADTANSIEQTLTDALMRGFESGKDFAETLKDTVKNMFQTLVLRPLIQPTMSMIAGAVAGVVPGTAGASGGGGLLGSVAQAGLGLSGLGSAFAGGAGWLFGSGASLGGTLGAAGSLIGAGGASTLSGLALGAGALAPILAPLAILGLGGMFNKPSNRAAWGDVDLSSGVISGLGNMTGDKQADQGTMDARTVFLEAIGAFGSSSGASGSVRIDVGGRDGIQAAFDGGELQSFGSDPDAALMGILDEVIKSATIDPKIIAQWQVLKTSLDGTAKSALEMVDVMALLANDVSMVDIERANIIQGENESLGQSYARLADMMGLAMDAGETWRAAQGRLAEQFAELGISVPESSEAFGELLAGIDITTESGRELFKELSELGAGFLAVAREIEAALEMISASTASSIRDIELSLLDDAGKYSYFDQELAQGQQDLASAITPAEVAQQAEENRQIIMDSWSLVPEELKASLADEFIGLLKENEALAAERLTTINPDGAGPITDDGQSALDEAVARAIENAAASVSKGGEDILTAADRIANAVEGIPDRIVVQVGGSDGVHYA